MLEDGNKHFVAYRDRTLDPIDDWRWDMYDWGIRVRRDILLLEKAVKKLAQKANLRVTNEFVRVKRSPTTEEVRQDIVKLGEEIAALDEERRE